MRYAINNRIYYSTQDLLGALGDGIQVPTEALTGKEGQAEARWFNTLRRRFVELGDDRVPLHAFLRCFADVEHPGGKVFNDHQLTDPQVERKTSHQIPWWEGNFPPGGTHPCFTVTGGGVTPGIMVSGATTKQGDKFPVVEVGARRNNGRVESIPARNVQAGGRMVAARIGATRAGFVALENATPLEVSEGALVLFEVDAAYRGSGYLTGDRVDPSSNAAFHPPGCTIIAHGERLDSPQGALGAGKSFLCYVPYGTVLRTRAAGRRGYSCYHYISEGGVQSLSWDAREANGQW